MKHITPTAVLGLGLGAIALMSIQVDAIFPFLTNLLTPQRNGPGLCVGCQCGRGNNGWVAIIYVGNTLTTTGALVSRRHIVTAATAVNGVPSSDIIVSLGTSNRCVNSNTGLNSSVSSVTVAPGNSDLAVLTLPNDVSFTNSIQSICLPPFANSGYQGNSATVISWGPNSTSSNNSTNATAAPCVSRQTYLPILSPQSCSTTLSGTGCIGVQGVPSLFCPTDAGALVQYNSGTSNQLIGILPSSNQCGNGTQGPSTFVRTAPLLQWLLSTTRDSCYCTVY